MNTNWLIVIYRDKDKICYHAHMDKSYAYILAGVLLWKLDKKENQTYGMNIFPDIPEVLKAIKDSLTSFNEQVLTDTEVSLLLVIATTKAQSGVNRIVESKTGGLL